MMNHYSQNCDEFGIFTHLNTRLDLSNHSETILHFFDVVQKAYPELTTFDNQDREYSLEGEKDLGSYRLVNMEPRRITSGFMNPGNLELADEQNLKILELAKYHFDIGHLNCESLDVMFTFHFDYDGNQDEIVAEALGGDTSFFSLFHVPGARVLHFEPSILITLDSNTLLQCRVNIETRSIYSPTMTNLIGDMPLTICCKIRQLWGRSPIRSFAEAYQNQRDRIIELTENHILPFIVQPIGQTISSK